MPSSPGTAHRPPSAPKALIVGAGPVGCLAAGILARRGYAVDVVEKRPHFRQRGLRDEGRTINLSLSPRGAAALDGFCTPAELAALTVEMRGRVRHEPDGSLRAAGYGDDSWRNLSIDRNELTLLLLSAAGPKVRFAFDTECVSIDADRQRATCADRGGRESVVGYDLLVGADGTHSAVRGALEAHGVLHSTRRQIGVDYREVTFDPVPGAEPPDPSALHVWPRGRFFMVGLPSRDGSLRCTLVLPSQGTPAFADLPTDAALGAFLQRHFPDAVGRRIRAGAPPAATPISVVECAPVVYGGSAVLLGDAAHTVAPFLGQGANLGLEDCAALDRFLGQFGGDRAAALSAFEQERLPEHEAAAALSLANFGELSGAPDSAPPADPAPAQAPPVPLPTLVNFATASYREALDAYTGAARPARLRTAGPVGAQPTTEG